MSPDPGSSDSRNLREIADNAAAFSCTSQADNGKVRVEMSATNRWVLIDAQGADHSQDVGATSAVYLVERSPTKQHPERARISLEALTPGDRLADRQNGWQTAKEKGWMKSTEPFLLERSPESAWCRSAESGCEAGETGQNEFIDSVGNTVGLLDLPRELSSSLDGLENDGLLSLPLPASVMKKIGVVDHAVVVARSRGPGYPATFVATHAEDRTGEETRKNFSTGVETKVPRQQHIEITVTFTLSQRCQLLELARSDSSFLPEQFPGTTGLVRTDRWRFTPLGN